MEQMKIVIEGFTHADVERFESMNEIIDSCNQVGVAPPVEALDFVLDYNNGIYRKTHKLRVGIENGVSTEGSMDNEFIVIDLSKINKDIDFLKIHNELV